MARSKGKVPVAPRALVKRINRSLAEQDEQLRKNRRYGMGGSLGEYYVVDLNLNAVIHQDVDLESFGRELGVLKPFEEVAEDE